jgi:hypothetical protein
MTVTAKPVRRHRASKKVLRVIAAVEIAGSIGVFALTWSSLWLAIRTFASWSDVLMAIVFEFWIPAVALVGGVLLWKLRPAGVRLSALAQLPQLLSVVSPTITYKLVMGVGFLLFANLQTGIVGAKAELGDIETTLAFGQSGSTVIYINLVAAWIFYYLLRTLIRDVEGDCIRFASASDREPVSVLRRLSRFAMKSVIVLLAIVFVPAFGLWVYNRFDERPTVESMHWFLPIDHSVADRDNAWLYMIGIGAAAADDPINRGRQILDAYETREASPMLLPPSEEEKTLKIDPLPFVSTNAGNKKIDIFCNFDSEDCLAWARKNEGDLNWLETANAVRLGRFETMIGMTNFEESSTPANDSPLPDISSDDALYRALILRDIGEPSKRADAIRRLNKVAAFWRRVEEPAPSLLMKSLAEHGRERCMRILDAAASLLANSNGDLLATGAGTVLQAPTTAQREWEYAFRNEAVRFERVIDKSIFPGPIDAARYCKSQCFTSWLTAQFFERQATRNLSVKIWDALLAVHMAEPHDIPAAQKKLSAVFEAISPLTDSGSESLRRISYNGVGRVLVSISLPAYADYLYFQHDVEDIRRAVSIKISAMQEHIPAAKMAEFLSSQPESLRDVYTDEPFVWEPAAKEIRFVPKSKKWKQSVFAVTYFTEAPRPIRGKAK